MSFFFIFGGPPCPSDQRATVQKLIEDLIKLGKTDDYLSERPAQGFNRQFRSIRAREIGERLHQIGGARLMEYARRRVRKVNGKDSAEHLDYAWADIGEWIH